MWIKTKTLGIRYREHSDRKNGLQKDRYYTIRYKLNGKDKEEGLGWASEGWTEKKAAEYLFELKKNQRIGEGAKTLAEKRELVKKQEIINLQNNQKEMTFSELYSQYIENQKTKTGKKTWESEMSLYKNWIAKEIGHMKLTEIKIDNLQPIITNILNAGKKPATAKYLKAFIRQVFNYAIERDIFSNNNPALKISTPNFDNRRQRFFTMEEIQLILSTLKNKSKQWHDIALFAMYTGCRPIEIFSLTWENINFKNDIITIFDTKNKKKTKNIPMIPSVKKLFEELKTSDSRGLIFKSTKGTRIKSISNTFAKTLNELGLNANVEDERQKAVFYTLRHSYASWLIMSGTDLYTTQKLMGHSTIAMTERYSHLAHEHLKKAVNRLEEYMNQ